MVRRGSIAGGKPTTRPFNEGFCDEEPKPHIAAAQVCLVALADIGFAQFLKHIGGKSWPVIGNRHSDLVIGPGRDCPDFSACKTDGVFNDGAKGVEDFGAAVQGRLLAARLVVVSQADPHGNAQTAVGGGGLFKHRTERHLGMDNIFRLALFTQLAEDDTAAFGLFGNELGVFIVRVIAVCIAGHLLRHQVDGCEGRSEFMGSHGGHGTERGKSLFTGHDHGGCIEGPDQARLVLAHAHSRDCKESQADRQSGEMAPAEQVGDNGYGIAEPGQRHRPHKHAAPQGKAEHGEGCCLHGFQDQGANHDRRDEEQQERVGEPARERNDGRKLGQVERDLCDRLPGLGQPIERQGEGEENVQPGRCGNGGEAKTDGHFETEPEIDDNDGGRLPCHSHPAERDESAEPGAAEGGAGTAEPFRRHGVDRFVDAEALVVCQIIHPPYLWQAATLCKANRQRHFRSMPIPMRLAPLAVSALALTGCGDPGPTPTAGGAQAGCMTRAYEQIGGPISLVDHTGAAVTEAAFKGEPSLVFFGFTYCPDVCPLTLVNIENALAALPEGTEPPRTILISIDPGRDTPEALATYIATEAFPDKITGLTGTEEQIRAATDAFLADYSRIDQPESLSEYTMNHTDLIYFMDENWEQKTFFPSITPPDEMAQCLGAFL